MAFTISTIAGVNVDALASPTYTTSIDVGPNPNSKQWAITAVGGTAAGVRTHSISDPFTLTVIRPQNYRPAPVLSQGVAAIGLVQKNTMRYILRKGLLPLAGQAPQIGVIDIRQSIPAGADLADPINLAAMWSALAGFCRDQAQNIVNTAKNGVL